MRRILFTICNPNSATTLREKESAPFTGSTEIFICRSALEGSGFSTPYSYGLPKAQETPYEWDQDGYFISLPYVPKGLEKPPVDNDPARRWLQAISIHMRARRPYSMTLDGPLFLSLCFVYPLPKRENRHRCPATRPALQSLANCILWAGDQTLWFDHAQVLEMHLSKRYSEHPHTEEKST